VEHGDLVGQREHHVHVVLDDEERHRPRKRAQELREDVGAPEGARDPAPGHGMRGQPGDDGAVEADPSPGGGPARP
jgi:hypothetical protein